MKKERLQYLNKIMFFCGFMWGIADVSAQTIIPIATENNVLLMQTDSNNRLRTSAKLANRPDKR